MLTIFFISLYSEEHLHNFDGFPTNRIVPPDSNSNNALMNEITTTELYFAIKSSASRKSSGSDGIPKGFYQKAFEIIHPHCRYTHNNPMFQNMQSTKIRLKI